MTIASYAAIVAGLGVLLTIFKIEALGCGLCAAGSGAWLGAYYSTKEVMGATQEWADLLQLGTTNGLGFIRVSAWVLLISSLGLLLFFGKRRAS